MPHFYTFLKELRYKWSDKYSYHYKVIKKLIRLLKRAELSIRIDQLLYDNEIVIHFYVCPQMAM